MSTPTHLTSSGAASAQPLRVLHVLAVSLPHQNGYTVRSRYIVENQRRAGWAEPTVVTSPFYPGNTAAIEDSEIAGVLHHRVPHPADCGWRLGPTDQFCRLFFRLRKSRSVLALHRRLVQASDHGGDSGELQAAAEVTRWRRAAGAAAQRLLRFALTRRMVDRLARSLELIEESLLARRFDRGIRKVACRTGAQLIHVHSPYRAALPAIRASRALRLPVVYEVRGLWEESAVVSGWFQRGDTRYRHWRRNETEAMRLADAVVTIGDVLREEVVSRGVPREQVFVVPNAVDVDRFRKLDREEAKAMPPVVAAAIEALSEQLRGTTLGYVGSVRAMEGVDELIRGAAQILAAGRDISVLIVGDGPELKALAELAAELGISERVQFPGRVAHESVVHYYRLIDIFVVSRPDHPVTRKVTPLKPLEAMASGKALLVSDLPALREMVEDGETGLVYRPGDLDDLARQAGRLIDDPVLLAGMGGRARRWVCEFRTWERVLAVLPSVYRAAREARRASTVEGI